jgi:hypothetical protein
VFRDDAGVGARVIVMPSGGAITFRADEATIAAGVGCKADSTRGLTCSAAGVTGIRLLMDDGDDTVVAGGRLPLHVDLGAGDDEIVAGAGLRMLTATGGPGDDRIEASPSMSAAVSGDAGRDNLVVDAGYSAAGPYTVDGGPDADTIDVGIRGPGMTLAGGDGDDDIRLLGAGEPVTITCGAGRDQWRGAPDDVLGDGCAPHLAGITPRSVSRAFREGSLSAAASGSVTFRRRVGDQGRPREIIARGSFTALPGTLRVSLKPTKIGRRWLRRDPRVTVFVYVRTRDTAGERGEVSFPSRIR